MKENYVFGRPSVLTEKVKEDLLYAVSKLSPIKLACDYAMISHETFFAYMRKAKEDKENGQVTEFTDFSDSIKKAFAQKAHKLMNNIENGEKGWQGSAWLLERCAKEYFGQEAGIIEEIQKQHELLLLRMNERKD